VERRLSFAELDAHFGLRRRRHVSLFHWAPGIVGDVLERRQGVAGHRPVDAGLLAAAIGLQRHAAAAGDADEIVPGQEDQIFAGCHAASIHLF